jgi:hypothetical protein
MAKMKNAPTFLVKNHEANGQLGRPSHRLEDNIKMELKIICFYIVKLICVAKVRVQWYNFVNTANDFQDS